MEEYRVSENHPSQHVSVDSVSWSRLILFPQMARAASIGLQPNRIVMGLMVMIVLMVSGSLWDLVFSAPSRDIGVDSTLIHGAMQGSINAVSFEQTKEIIAFHISAGEDELLAGAPLAAVARVVLIPFRLVDHFRTVDPAYLFLFGAWILVVWCAGSGMICRSAACDFALKQQIPWTEALTFSLRHWLSSVSAFLLPLVLVGSAFLLLAVAGMLLLVPGLDIVASILYGAALFGSFLAVSVLVLTVLGSILFVPAVAVESADAPDALARGFSYIKNRPLHFVWYLALAILLGLVVMTVVAFIATETIRFTSAGAQFFLSSDLADYAGRDIFAFAADSGDDLLSGTTGVAATVISLWRTVVVGVIAGVVVSYICSAQTVIYFLMRKATDDQDLDEIWLEGMIGGTLAPMRMTQRGTRPRDV